MTMETTIDWMTWPKSHWQAWLEKQVELRRQVFLTDPDEMASAFNRERDSARDYYGRELLELLQNADDAGAEQDQKNRVLIQLENDTLYVANTGQPFSPAGVKSLMVSNNSPKQLSRTRFIGYKGLGFRSVLGWASKIAILSANLEIGFAEEEAIRIGKEIYRQHEGIKKLVDGFLDRTKTFPIATLSFPFWINVDSINDEKFSDMIRKCKSIREEGFDTCIGFLLRNPTNTREKVLSQISSLGKELLIFSNYLEQVDIRATEAHVTWYADREDSKVIVASDTEGPSLWEVFSKSDRIPPEYIGPGQPQDMLYEIKVAIPYNGIGQDCIFVYFPTQVSFPFPVVAHATFELVGNRQHLIDSETNRFLCGELASVMADAAEKSIDPSRSWRGLSIVTPTSAIDKVLVAMNFSEKLRSSCSDKRIIPVWGSNFTDAKHTKSIDGNFDELLQGEIFADLCLWTDDSDIETQLQTLGVEPITKTELKERIDKVTSTFSLETRAKLIYNLIDNNIVSEDSVPALLIDTQNKIIPDSTSPFLPPEGRTFSLPDWVPTRFVNTDLVKVLQEEFGVSRVRDLATKLRVFKVQEYNFTSILQSIVAETNRRVQALQENESQIRREMLCAIWYLYRTRAGDETIPTAQRVTYIVLTRKGTFSPSDELYFGKEYPSGELIEALLGDISPDKFIASPDELGLGNVETGLEPFLRWLGVTHLPRLQVQTSNSNVKYRDYVLSSLRYPVRFDEFQFYNVEEVKSNYPGIRQVQSFDNIDNILKSSDSNAIITWIAIDNRVEKLRNEGDTGARITVLPYKKQNYRYLRDSFIPSYPVWLFEYTEWLPTSAGRKSPIRCTIAKGLPGELSNIIGIPAIDTEAPIFKKYNIDRTAIAKALLTIGVINNIDDLPGDTYYQILQDLPDVDPNGAYARSLYRLFITRDEQDNSYNGKPKADFFNNGRMYGKHCNTYGYFPIDKLYYIDNFALFSHIETYFPLLELDKRRGGNKVRRLFNVKTLTAEELGTKLTVTDYVTHPGAEDLKREIERMKPFIYALRFDDDADRSELSPLKKLDIKLCRSVTAELMLDDRVEQIELKQGESLKEGDITYLVGDPEEYDRSFLRDPIIADAIGEIISTVLRVNLSSDIAFLLTCKPTQKKALLDRMLGGDGEEKLNETKKLLQAPLEEEEEIIYNHPPITLITPASAPTVPTIGEEQPPTGPEPTQKLPPSAIGSVEVTPKENIPNQGRVSKKIRIVRSPNPKPQHRRILTNPDRAENLVMKFEENQGRFPVKVSDIKGEESYGCDILSFISEDDRTEFQLHPDIAKIVRFIEVKGSGISKGSITLKGNELKAANNYKDRFFLYRVFEDPEEQGIFELIELADPLGAEEGALELEYEVHPYRTEAANKWSITEIIENEQD